MLKIIKSDKFSWANSDSVDELTLNRLKKLFKVHPLDIEDIQAEIHDPKLDIYKNYLFIIFNLPKYNAQHHTISSNEIDVFLSKDFLVTVHKKNVPEIDEIFKKLENNNSIRKDWLGRGSDFLLFKVLQQLFKVRMRDVADKISNKLLEVEARVYNEGGKQSIKDLADLRRNVLQLRRMVDPQRSIFDSLGSAKEHFIREVFDPYFDDIKDFLDKIWIRLENYKDTVDGLYDTNESLLAYKTNEIIKLLTIISVSIMPFTLLSGIYGMNIVLPFQAQSNAVWTMFGILLLSVALLFIVLRKRKWF